MARRPVSFTRVRDGSRRLVGSVALASVLAWSCPVHAGAGESTTSTEREGAARVRFEEGVTAFEAGHYHEAIAQFLAADELAPRAALAFNVARAYDLSGDAAGALRYYREYLRREPDAPNAGVVHERIAKFEATLAGRGVQQLTVYSDPPGAFLGIDGRPSGVTPWTGELTPGPHRFTFTREGYAEVVRDVTVDALHAGEFRAELAAEAAAAPPPVVAPVPKPERDAAGGERTAPRARFGVWPWVALGAGGGALLASGAFELARRGAESRAHDATTQLDYADALASEQARQTTARVLLATGSALVVTGGVLLTLELTSKQKAAPRATALFACTTDRCTAAVRGSF